ncbi:MAG TPA: KH domain-containing protein [Patescibacteria group bacterium]|nr:KH domain-containing protein [Patescibacteria group bacterium]
MKDTLQYIVTSIVDNPDAISIEETEAEGITTFTLHVHKDDMGKVIGKEGKVIRSIRNIMKISAMKNNRRINVTLAEQAEETE